MQSFELFFEGRTPARQIRKLLGVKVDGVRTDGVSSTMFYFNSKKQFNIAIENLNNKLGKHIIDSQGGGDIVFLWVIPETDSSGTVISAPQSKYGYDSYIFETIYHGGGAYIEHLIKQMRMNNAKERSQKENPDDAHLYDL